MDSEKRLIKILLLVVAFGVGLAAALQNLAAIGSLLKLIFGLLAPLIIGLCIAFILSQPVKFFEEKILGRLPRKARRPLAILLTVVAIVVILGLVIFMVVPQLEVTFKALGPAISQYWKQVIAFAEEQLRAYPDLVKWFEDLVPDLKNIFSSAISFVTAGVGDVLDSTVSVATSIFNGAFNFIIGAVFAVYVLMSKETLARQCRKLLYAFLPEKWAEETLSVASLSHKTFVGFLGGQCTEAVILGTLFFVAMNIFRFPYALLVSLVIAVTALIPIFGAFIGCVFGAFLMLIESPLQALWFVVMFLILQQLEGNLIYPHVVGRSVGLPSMWILLAVSVGGSVLGVAGMLIFIPAASVAYTLLGRIVRARLEKKGIEPQKYETPAPMEVPPRCKRKKVKKNEKEAEK